MKRILGSMSHHVDSNQSVCPALNIDCRIMVTMCHKATSNTPMLTLRQRLPDAVAALRAVLTRICSGHLHYFASSIRSFGAQYLNEGSPCCIRDSFGQAMILDQALDVQIFNRNHVILGNQLIAQFVKEVGALIRYLEMLSSKDAACLVAIRTAPFLLADFALRYLYRALCLLQEARVLYDFAVGERGEVLKPNIDTSSIAGLWDEARLTFFNCKDDKPAVRLALDGAGLDRALNIPTKAQPTSANLAQRQLVAGQSKTALWVGEGIEKPFPLKARVAGLIAKFHATKESVKGFVQTAQGVLQDLTMNAASRSSLISGS